MTEKSTVEGGCLCGRIRFSTTSSPSYQLLCYCTDCQTIGGAASYAAYWSTHRKYRVAERSPWHL